MEAAALGGGGIGAIGDLVNAKSASQAGRYNAEMANQNAELSLQQATEEARRSRALSRKTIGDMRANFAASGGGLDGSALDVLADSASNAEMDALTIEHQGQVRAQMFRNDATMDMFRGTAQRNSSYLRAGGSLLAAGGKAYGGAS